MVEPEEGSAARGRGPGALGSRARWAAFGCGSVLVLGAAIVGGLLAVSARSVTTDPDRVRAIAREIRAVVLPEHCEPQLAVSIGGLRLAYFGDAQAKRPFVCILASAPSAQAGDLALRVEERRRSRERLRVVEDRGLTPIPLADRAISARVRLLEPERAGSPLEEYSLTLEDEGEGEGEGRTTIIILAAPPGDLDAARVQAILTPRR